MAVKTLPFRLYAQILILSALVALGALILWSLQQVLQWGITSVRDGLIARLEQQIDRKIQYSSISPSLFGSFDVRNVRIIGVDGSPLLTMSRFRIAYSLLDLLRGKPQAIYSVQIDTPSIDFNTAYDHDLLDMLERLSSGENNSLHNFEALFPEKLMVRIRNGKFLIVDGGNSFVIDSLIFNSEITDNRIVFDSRWNTGFTADRLIGGPVNLSLAMRANGSCRADMKEGNAFLDVVSISGDAHSSIPLSLGMVMQDNVINLRNITKELSLAFSLDYERDTKDIDLRFACNDFALNEFLSFSGGLAGAVPLLDVVSSGTASFVRKQDGTLAYTVDIAGKSTASGSPSPRSAPASFQIDIAGNEQQAVINAFHVSMPTAQDAPAFFYGDVNFSGNVGLNPIAPNGTLVLDTFSLSGMESINARIAVSTRDQEISVLCRTLNMGQVELIDFNALLWPWGEALDFSVSASNRRRTGSIALDGSLRPQLLEANIQLHSFSAGDLAGVITPFTKSTFLPASLNGMLSGAAITTELFLNTDFESLSYNALRFYVVSRAGKGFEGFTSISGSNNRIALHGGRLRSGGEELVFSGQAEFAQSQNSSFSIDAAYRSLGYLVEGSVLNGKQVNIKGSYGLNVNLISSGGRGYSGSLRADGFPVPFLGQLSLAAQVRYNTATSWSMALEHFELAGMASPTGPAQLLMSGNADQNGAKLSQLYYCDGLGPLSGQANVTWTEAYGFTGTADMENGAERYHAEGTFADGHLDLILAVSSMRLDRVFSTVRNASASGDMRLSWDSFNSFRAAINLFAINGMAGGKEFEARAFAVLDSEALRINNLHFGFAAFEGEVSNFTINGERGTARVNAALKGSPGGKPLTGNLSLAANFKPIRSWFEVGEIARSVSGTLHVADLLYGTEGEAQTFDIAFSRSDGIFLVSGGPRDMLRLRMDTDGNFYGGLSSPFPIRGTVIGSVRNNTINARCGDLYVDLADLFALLPDDLGFYLTGGYVNASVEIKGSLSDPEFFGTVRASSLRIKVPSFITNELRPIPFTAIIDGNEIRVGPVSVASGSGAATVVGVFLFDRWIPNIFSVDVTISHQTPIPYGFNISGFSARGNASGTLNISMENQGFDISGDLLANNTTMSMDSEGVPVTAKYPTVVNFTLNTGPIVEFFYPNTRFPVLRVNPDIGSKAYVTADSLAGQFTLNGDVRIRGGEMFYFERNFYVRSGMMIFRENELHFDPRLTARAEIRDRTEDGPVTISMIVDNAPVSSFTARFESNPVLSQMEIYALLGQTVPGALPEDNVNSIQRAVFGAGSELVTHLIIGRQLEQQIRNFTRLDMFNVRTQVVQNALFMATGLTPQPVDRNVSVGNYFDNTTVFGGKYIGQDMFVQGMLSMRYNANNTSLGGLTFTPDIGVELQNPLFSVRWDFIPTHPENWYVNDNSITLTWSRSF